MNRSFLALVMILAVAGCTNVRDTLGLGKNPPDEFAVVTRAPLSVPPTYDLRPPMPGATRPQEQGTRQLAQQALTGQVVPIAPATTVPGALQPVAVNPAKGAGESTLLQQAGATQVPDTVRNQVDAETAQMESVNQSLLAKINQTDKPQPVVDPTAEAQRVRQLKQTQQPVTGQGAKVAAPQQKSTLDRLFGWFGE